MKTQGRCKYAGCGVKVPYQGMGRPKELCAPHRAIVTRDNRLQRVRAWRARAKAAKVVAS